MAAAGSSRRNGMLLVALLATQLLMMSSSVKARADATLLETWVVGLTSPVVTLAHWVGDGVRDSWNWTTGLLGARARNVELEAELIALKSEARKQRESVLENARLRDLLDMRLELLPESIGASVVTANLTGSDRLLIVDRGTRQGVRVDLPVVARGGVVGKVVAAFPSRAKIRLITDPNSGVAGVIQRNRARGIVFGTGAESLDLHYVARFSDVVAGDRVVTSAADGIFPRGFGIGTVAAVNEDTDGTQVIVLEPEIDFAGLEEVLVLLDSSGGGISTPDLLEPQ